VGDRAGEEVGEWRSRGVEENGRREKGRRGERECGFAAMMSGKALPFRNAPKILSGFAAMHCGRAMPDRLTPLFLGGYASNVAA
jgi:hypothetical protein